MADQMEPVHFFDIKCSLEGPRQSWSPNTLKTRAVLNYKGIKYTQSFISYPDIAPVSKDLGLPPQSGSEIQYTLPAIVHKASITSNPNGAMWDSFPIALHLEKAFPAPEYPSIFPGGQASITLTFAVEKLIYGVLAKCSSLLFPSVEEILDERGAEYFEKTRVPMFQTKYPDIKTMADLKPKTQEEYDDMVAATRKELGVFDKLLAGDGTNKGPFLEGEKPGYADIMLAVHLAWIERPCPKFFEAVLDAGDGSVRRHWEASQSFLNGQGEMKDWAIPKI